ncbi:hypothetical protein A3J41_01800 [candidate division TM6 bacterium RIFCSPHIGHO2_12_FULL_38_8]|nr:MAG: hypothetical protein A3J41_01800 [candidate division TM6 bacterium RIFCSPHIGHO2_12_FULL_38_8]
MSGKIIPHILMTMCIFHSVIVVAQSPAKVKNNPISSEIADFKIPDFNENDQSLASLTRQEVDLVNFFCKPIEFTPDGISYYFKYVYNHPEYVNYLPYNFSHMIQFLQYGIRSGQNEQFAGSVIKMFLQKIKAAPYVEAESFAEFLPKLTQAMKPFLEKKEASFLHEMQIVIKEKLSKIFAQYFAYFQKNPDGFMNSLAEQIAKQTNQSITQQHIDVEHLKKDILRFIEMASNKLVWSSKDDIQVWYTCNRLAHECQICLDQKVLCNQDALDDICWSFIHRFCYFVELSHEVLSKNFFAQVLHDLQTKPLALVALEEQEDLMTTKKSHLMSRMQLYKDMRQSIVGT